MKDRTRALALTAMVTALNVLCLYASEVVTGTRLLFCFLCSLFIQVLVCEGYIRWAFMSYLATVLLGFVLCPDRISWFFIRPCWGITALCGSFSAGILRWGTSAACLRCSTAIWARLWPCGPCIPLPP